MSYAHYVSGEILMDMISFNISLYFGTYIMNEEILEEGELYGIGITILMFEFKLGIIESI